MAKTKLPRRQFRIQSDAGETLEFSCDVQIDAQGIFYMQTPIDIPDFAECLDRHIGCPGRYDAKVANKPHVQKAQTHSYLVGRSLEDLDALMRTGAKEYLKCEETVETILRFWTDTHANYFVGDDGILYPNQNFAKGVPGFWSKDGPRGYDYSGPFCVGISAAALTKTTLRRGSFKKVAYAPFYGEGCDHHETGTPAARINAYPRMAGNPGRGVVPLEVPYTDEKAVFFLKLVEQMVELHFKLTKFEGAIRENPALVEEQLYQLPFLK